MQCVAREMERKIPGKERRASVAGKKDTLAKTRSARRVVKSAESVVDLAISKLNVLGFISVAMAILDRAEERRVAEVPVVARMAVDLVEVNMDAEEGERQTF